MQRQRPGHRILSFHHRGLLLLAAAVAVMLFFLYGCVAGAAYSPRGRLVFIPLAQVSGSNPPSPLVFFLISTHFTATQGIPITSPALKTYSFKCSFRVKP